MENKKVIGSDVYDSNGNLLRIEFYNFDGEFEIQVEYDPRDDQSSEKRTAFRKWAKTAVERIGFKIPD